MSRRHAEPHGSMYLWPKTVLSSSVRVVQNTATCAGYSIGNQSVARFKIIIFLISRWTVLCMLLFKLL